MGAIDDFAGPGRVGEIASQVEAEEHWKYRIHRPFINQQLITIPDGHDK
jgi:hypothetical protein